ncbi:MAG: hypothetical protein HY905_05160 [Deltaproteobacteria bacterium]|nr:hypothetical protein [Deltaproteobacteria bacterium]
MPAASRAPFLLACAGDPSGDQLAARAVQTWFAAHPDGVVEGFGGPALAAAGLRTLPTPLLPWPFPSPTGLLEPLRAVPALLACAHAFLRRAREARPHAALLVDLPDVNLPLGRRLRTLHVPVLQAVAPQTWAWRPGRISALRDSCDILAVILPFEEGYFRSFGIDARYVGHPLIERLGPLRAAVPPAPAEAISLALLPGSRPERVRHVLPALLAGAREAEKHGGLDSVVVSRAPAVDRSMVAAAIGAARIPVPVHLAEGPAVPAPSGGLTFTGASPGIRPASQVWVAAGTASLEIAAAGIPACVAYRTGTLGFAIARRLVRGRWAGLANRLLGREVQPELLQDDLSPSRLAGMFEHLRVPEAFRSAADAASELRALLGGPGFSRNLAALVDEVGR